MTASLDIDGKKLNKKGGNMLVIAIISFMLGGVFGIMIMLQIERGRK